MEKKKYVKVCSQCGSTNIKMPGPRIGYQGANPLYSECMDCHYMCPAFPEFPKEKVKKAQEEIRKERVRK